MNLLLHGIGPGAEEGKPPIETRDSLAVDTGKRYSMVLTNPPFGKKSSVMILSEEGEASTEALTVTREDFWATTSNKQLNFMQHVKTILQISGRAAVVVPDNVRFEGGAGETIRRNLLHDCDVHTLLRLPTGIFYAQGVKAFWLKDESLEATQNLPPPADIAREIVEDLRAALEQFEGVTANPGA